jgi:N6-adenosine-specific RNA methylase IME4
VKYATILADPPWAKGDQGQNVGPKRFRSGERVTTFLDNEHGPRTYKQKIVDGYHYPVMQLEEIMAVPVADLAADSAHLWLWSLNSTMEQAYRVVRAWGFAPLGLVTYHKNSYGLGMYFRLSTEQLIFATRGKSMLPDKAWMGTCIQAPRLRHSQKPDSFYDMIEAVSPGPRMELFARRVRLGWDRWGNEVDSTVQL